ncbi:MAG: ThuA domain-containing protein [Sphingomonadales bacterium]|nr:ThuA domain-containing protein [Sphingomonadales bacterium]MDE2568929.1 ThuA domain-containing protein [Sphingomonadales bacterium]
MPVVDYRAPLQCLAAVRGHPFDRNGFAALFEGMEGISVTMVDQPVAARLMTREGMAGFDVLILYDMPGLDFGAPENTPLYVEPPAGLREGLAALCAQGTGILALHHALAGWPAWPEYGEMLGGRFFYHPGDWRGAPVPDSGYAHDVTYEVEVVADHPVTHGVSPRFTVTDEPYLAEVDEAGVTPLLRSSHGFTRDNFFSAELAVRGQMYAREGWEHPPGSNLIGWTKKVDASRLVYLQPGDSPAVFGHPDYRRLVENAIRWLAAPKS